MFLVRCYLVCVIRLLLLALCWVLFASCLLGVALGSFIFSCCLLFWFIVLVVSRLVVCFVGVAFFYVVFVDGCVLCVVC